MDDAWVTEDTEPTEGSDGWYVTWQFTDPEHGGPTSYAEKFATREEGEAAIMRALLLGNVIATRDELVTAMVKRTSRASAAFLQDLRDR